MLQLLMISQAVLLVLVAILAVVLLLTIRQLGVLYERIAPLGALTLPHALGPGEAVAPIAVATVTGESMVLGGRREGTKKQLLLFVSPACPMCAQVMGWLRSFTRSESASVDVVLIGDGDAQEYAGLLRKYGLTQLPMVLDGQVGLRYQVGKLPYGLLIEPTGILRAAGLINSREHLESLVVASEHGVGSVQEYLRGGTRSQVPREGGARESGQAVLLKADAQ